MYLEMKGRRAKDKLRWSEKKKMKLVVWELL